MIIIGFFKLQNHYCYKMKTKNGFEFHFLVSGFMNRFSNKLLKQDCIVCCNLIQKVQFEM